MICDICMMLFVVCLQEAVSRAIKDLMPCICEWFCWLMCLSLVFVGWFLSVRPWQQCQDSPVGRSSVAFDAQLCSRTPSRHHRTTPSRIERPWQVPSFGRAGPDRKPVLRLYLRRNSSNRVLCCEMHSCLFSLAHISQAMSGRMRARAQKKLSRKWKQSAIWEDVVWMGAKIQCHKSARTCRWKKLECPMSAVPTFGLVRIVRIGRRFKSETAESQCFATERPSLMRLQRTDPW